MPPQRCATPSQPFQLTAFQIIMLTGSGVLAASQIGKTVISMSAIRAEMGFGCAIAGFIMATFATLGAAIGIGAAATPSTRPMNSLLRFALASAILSVATIASAAQERNDLADALIRYVKCQYSEALGSLLPLARGGDLVAQEIVAFMYLRGEGIPVDLEKALEWLRLAADGGRTEAQYELGRLYRDGLGVPKSSSTAVFWFSKAADKNVGHAMNALGELYCGRSDFAADYVAALAWFVKAAELGSAQAMLNIGFLYALGRGVDRSEIEAMKWFDLAMGEGTDEAYPLAARAQSKMAERLTPVEVQAASMSARNWLKIRRAASPSSIR